MERKDFLKKGLASGALLGVSAFASASGSAGNPSQQDGKEQAGRSLNSGGDPEEIVIEKAIPGKTAQRKSSFSNTGTFR